MWKNKSEEVQKWVAEQEENIIQFLRDILAIPSMESKIGEVGERIKQEMDKLGFSKTWFDSMGKCSVCIVTLCTII